MPDVDARLSSVEQRLEALGTRMDERFEQVDRRFEQVDQRFEQVDQRFEQVDQRFEQVDQRFGSLEAEVQKLRMLEEKNAAQIKVIAEVQGHHGKKLQQLVDAVAPLRDLRDFVKRVADDHENRIKALETPTTSGPPRNS